jgi:hypothetical protein
MAKIYWIGLGLYYVGLGLTVLPSGDLKFLTFSLGLTIQVAGTVLLLAGIFRTRREKGGKLDRKSYVFILIGVGLFIAGIIAGFLLARISLTAH